MAQEPPRLLKLSTVMQELSAKPEVVESFVQRLDQNPAAGGILGPENINRLRQLILGKDWEGLDRFPGITISGLRRGVFLAGKALGKPEPGKVSEGEKAVTPKVVTPKMVTEDWGIPAKGPGLTKNELTKEIGYGLLFGDLPDPVMAPAHANLVRLSEILNRLGRGNYTLKTPYGMAQTAEQFIEMLQANGYSVEVRDARYFANFGDLHYKGAPVFTPIWLDTDYRVPGTNRTLLVPVGHAQHEIHIQAPGEGGWKAALAFFFGIDGKTEIRPMDTVDQWWVKGRVWKTYRDTDARETVRLMGSLIRMYDRIQKEKSSLPFGGYYTLGVCNDPNAAIELKMTGKTTLYPITHNPEYFQGGGEAEALMRQLPVDGRGDTLATWERIRGSLAVENLSDLPDAAFASDVLSVDQASASGNLRLRGGSAVWIALIAVCVALLVVFNRSRKPPASV